MKHLMSRLQILFRIIHCERGTPEKLLAASVFAVLTHYGIEVSL